MFGFGKRKAMGDFYNRHRAFLCWYLNKKCDISEKFHFFAARYLGECLNDELEKVIRMDEREQRRWIMRRINEFIEDEK